MTASRRLAIFGFLTLLALLAGLAAATQDIASAFHYPRQFGGVPFYKFAHGSVAASICFAGSSLPLTV